MIRFPSAPTLPRLWAASIFLTGLALGPSLQAQSLSGGTLTLTGANTYTGSGSLLVNSGSLASSTINTSINSGATLINGVGATTATTVTLVNSGFVGGAYLVNSGTLNVTLGGGTVVLKSTNGTLTVTSNGGTLAYTPGGTTTDAATNVTTNVPAPAVVSPLPTPWNATGRSVAVSTTATGAAVFHTYTGGVRRYSAEPGGAVVTGEITLNQSTTGKLTGSITWSDTGLTEAVTGKRDLETGRGDFIERKADGTPADGAARIPFQSSKDGSLLTGGVMADNGESLTLRLTPGQ